MFEVHLSSKQIKQLRKTEMLFEAFTIEPVPRRKVFKKSVEALVEVGTVLDARIVKDKLLFEIKCENADQAENMQWLKREGLEFVLLTEPFLEIGVKPQLQAVRK